MYHCLRCKQNVDPEARLCACTTSPSPWVALYAPASHVWKPIETAPLDNKRPLYLARFDGAELVELDWDGSWESDQESWELPQVYYYWASRNGIEEPTHWAYQDSPPPPDDSTPPPTVWHRASEKLPTAKDGDFAGAVWMFCQGEDFTTRPYHEISVWARIMAKEIYWARTGITKPKPPEV